MVLQFYLSFVSTFDIFLIESTEEMLPIDSCHVINDFNYWSRCLRLVRLSVEILGRSKTDFHFKHFSNWVFPKFQSFLVLKDVV